MVKKMLLFIGLLFLFVTPALPSVHSTKYIYLRSTESAKMKKRPRSIKLLPIHATLEMNQLQIYFCEPLSLVDIVIMNDFTGEEIFTTSLLVENPTTYVINLTDFAQGNYVVKFVLSSDTIFGDFIIDQ